MTTDDAKYAGPDTDYDQSPTGYAKPGGEPSDFDFINSDLGEVNTEGTTDLYGFGTPSKPGPAMTMGTSGDLSYRYGPDRFAFQSSNNLKYALFRTIDTPTTEESRVRFNSALRVVPCVPLGNNTVELTGDTDGGPEQALILGGLDVTLNDGEYDGGDRNVPIQKFAQILQIVEGYNIASLINTFSTLSFWVKSSVPGTYCVSIRNQGAEGMDGFDVVNISQNTSSGHYYVSEYNIPEANRWYKIEISFKVNPVESIPGLDEAGIFTKGGWDATYGPGLIIGWTLVAHDDYQTNKVNRWLRIDKDNKYADDLPGADRSRFRYTKFLPSIASPNQTQFDDVPKDWRRIVWSPPGGNLGHTDRLITHFPEKEDGPDKETGFFLTGVQLEEGTESSDFEVRSRTDELSLCNRYFVKSMADFSDALIDLGPHDGGKPSGSSAPDPTGTTRTQGKHVSSIHGEVSYIGLPEEMRTIPTVAGFNNYAGDGRGIGIDWALFGNYNSRKQIVAYTVGKRRSIIPQGTGVTAEKGYNPLITTIQNTIAGESHWIANCEFFGGTISEGSQKDPFTVGLKE